MVYVQYRALKSASFLPSRRPREIPSKPQEQEQQRESAGLPELMERRSVKIRLYIYIYDDVIYYILYITYYILYIIYYILYIIYYILYIIYIMILYKSIYDIIYDNIYDITY